MLMPKRVKRRKQFRGSMKGKALRGNKINYGEFGLVALEPCWIKSNQIEAARIAMTRYIKRGGKVWIKIFPDKPVTAQPAGTPNVQPWERNTWASTSTFMVAAWTLSSRITNARLHNP